MDVTSHCNGSDITEIGANKSPVQSECISGQPTANGTLPHPNPDPLPAKEAPPPPSDRSVDGDSSDDSVADGSSTNDLARLLPASAPRKHKGVDSSSVAPPPPPPPVCTPPSSSFTRPPPPPSRGSACNRHNCSLPPPPPHHHHHHHRHHQRRHSTNQKRLSSTRSHASVRTDADHIKEVAGDDCCVHCLLACLFCELLSMCSVLGECLVCGVGGSGCSCCCVEAAGEAACTEEACQALLDCGILEDCCGSSDCLEVCLECCSICFPS